jgi:hypothetical protein
MLRFATLQARIRAINERRFQKIEGEVADMTDDIKENLKNMVGDGTCVVYGGLTIC